MRAEGNRGENKGRSSRFVKNPPSSSAQFFLGLFCDTTDNDAHGGRLPNTIRVPGLRLDDNDEICRLE